MCGIKQRINDPKNFYRKLNAIANKHILIKITNKP